MDNLRKVQRLQAIGGGFSSVMDALNKLQGAAIQAFDALDGEPSEQVPLLLLGQRLNKIHEEINAEARAWLSRETR